MTPTYVTAGILAVLVLILLLGSQVSLVTLLLLQMTASVVGMWILAGTGEITWTVFWTYLLAPAGLIAGRLIAGLRPAGSARAARPATALSDPVVWSVLIVAAVLAFYHLIKSGIPILSGDVEVERFDFTSSGLFGIPGRMYLFGLKIAWIVASVNAAVLRVPWWKYRPWLAASAALLLSSLLSGFKGQILSLAVIVLMVWCITHREPLSYWKVLRRCWPLGVAAVGYFLLVASQYGTYRVAQVSVAESAWDRFTTGSAQAPSIVLSGGFSYLPGNSLINDGLYYLDRYAGIGSGAPYALERAVSASTIGVDPASDAWTVPVTVGGYAELVFALGVGLAFLAMISIGFFLRCLETTALAGTVRLSLQVAAAFVVSSFVTKGGLVYTVVNWAAVLAMLAAVGAFAQVCTRHRTTDGRRAGHPPLSSAGATR